MAEEELEEYTLERVYLPTNTLGSIYSPTREMVCKTMELVWRGNRRDNPNTPINEASCIPEGKYLVIKQPPKPGRNYPYFRLPFVPGRSGILIHRITFSKDLLGCIGVGSKFVDLNKDNTLDMIESSKTLQHMIDTMPDKFYLTIKKKP